MTKDPCHNGDKIGLFALAGLVLCIIAGIAFGLFHNKGLPDGADGLLGTMLAGLLLFGREIISTIKASWEEVTRSKTNDQLAASGPLIETPVVPETAKDAAEQVAGAATAEAEKIVA